MMMNSNWSSMNSKNSTMMTTSLSLNSRTRNWTNSKRNLTTRNSKRRNWNLTTKNWTSSKRSWKTRNSTSLTTKNSKKRNWRMTNLIQTRNCLPHQDNCHHWQHPVPQTRSQTPPDD